MDRDIFTFNDGMRTRHGDPIRIHRRLSFLLDGDIQGVLDRLRDDGGVADDPVSREKMQYECMEKLLVAIRDAFKMMPYNEDSAEGSMDADCIRVFNDFLAYLEKKNQNGEEPPNTLPSTENPLPTNPTTPHTEGASGFG